jgi:hypothetical protein
MAISNHSPRWWRYRQQWVRESKVDWAGYKHWQQEGPPTALSKTVARDLNLMQVFGDGSDIIIMSLVSSPQ